MSVEPSVWGELAEREGAVEAGVAGACAAGSKRMGSFTFLTKDLPWLDDPNGQLAVSSLSSNGNQMFGSKSARESLADGQCLDSQGAPLIACTGNWSRCKTMNIGEELES